MQMNKNMIEMASIINVPVLTSGIFPSSNAGEIEITEADLDEIIEGSNLLQPLIKTAIKTGIYEGNPDVTEFMHNRGKPISGLLNLNHQKTLKDQVKNAVSDVTVTFAKAVIDGKNWIVKSFENVPNDVAETIKNQFQKRSVELLSLKDPNTGKLWPHIITATAFLDKLTRPAVSGQSTDLIVEFMTDESPLVVFMIDQPFQEESNMPEKTEELVVLQEMKLNIIKQDSKIVEQASKIVELEGMVREANSASVKKDEMIIKLKEKQDAVVVTQTLAELSRIRQHEGKAYQVSPAALEIIHPIIVKDGIFELAEGETGRSKCAEVFNSLFEMSLADNLFVSLSTQGQSSFAQPDAKPKTMAQRVNELVESGKNIYDASLQAEAEGCQDILEVA